jgi:hypothetical protein
MNTLQYLNSKAPKNITDKVNELVASKAIMKKYTFKIGPLYEMSFVSIMTRGGCEEAEAILLPSDRDKATLFSITKRMPMNGIIWR